MPAADWRTTSRFIRIGPAAHRPAQAGGAEGEASGEALGQVLVVAVRQERLELGPGLGIGVERDPAARRAPVGGTRRRSSDRRGHRAQQLAEAPDRGAPGGEHVLVVEGLGRHARGEVGHEGHPEHLGAEMTCRDRLEHG